jgi:hypothetical protein
VGGGGLINKEENTTKTSQTKEVFAGRVEKGNLPDNSGKGGKRSLT